MKESKYMSVDERDADVCPDPDFEAKDECVSGGPSDICADCTEWEKCSLYFEKD